MTKKILSIAGSDPSGGAGIQADLKTFAALNAYGMAVITALTAQNTQGVFDVHAPPANFLKAQLISVFEDIMPDAVKIGMVYDSDNINIVAEILEKYQPQNIVLDPVLVSTSGHDLHHTEIIDVLKRKLFPLVNVITPNIAEAQTLFGEGYDPTMLYNDLKVPVLVKGGHAQNSEAIDCLYDQEGCQEFKAVRINTKNTHGTGCTLSSAIAAYLAQGEVLSEAIQKAKIFTTNAIIKASAVQIGKGHGPLILHNF